MKVGPILCIYPVQDSFPEDQPAKMMEMPENDLD